MNKTVLIVIFIIVAAAGGFFAGTRYQKTQQSSFGQTGGFRQRFGQNAQAVQGNIVSVDSGSMTVQLNDGSSKLVMLSTTTHITKTATGSANELKTGEQVMVVGSNNSDGSVTAQVVQLNPMFRGPNPSSNTMQNQ